MTPPLVLAGAGGFARETIELVHALAGSPVERDLVGLLDDDPTLEGSLIGGTTVIGSLDLVHDRTDVQVVLCMANPARPDVRRRVARRLGLDDDRYGVLVHPSAVIARSALLGHGTVVQATVVLTADVTVGAHVVIMPGVVLTHDVVVGDHATLASQVGVAGGVVIGDSAYLGAGAVVREGCSIGEAAVVGAGAVVTRSIPAGETWAGVPARPLRAG